MAGSWGVVLVVPWLCLAAPVVARPGPVAESVQQGSTDANEIRTHARQILARPEYKPHRTFWEWLVSKLARRWIPKMDTQSWWLEVVIWVVLAWCILTLLAILIHMGWMVFGLVRGRDFKVAGKRPAPVDSITARSYDELRDLAAERARQGAFREAIGLQTLAAIKWLDGTGVLSFHQGKTNGDYLREYPRPAQGRDCFEGLVRVSERALYGGVECGEGTYRILNRVLEQLHDNVQPRS